MANQTNILPTTETETWEQRREREIAENKAHCLRITKTIRKVCDILGFIPKFDKPEAGEVNYWHSVRAEAVHPARGVSIHFRASNFHQDGKFQRITVCGYYNSSDLAYTDYLSYGEKRNDEISVSSFKSPDRIAADITRRLLPRVEELTKRVAAARERMNTYTNSKRAAMTQVLGREPLDRELKDGRACIDVTLANDVHVWVSTYSSDTTTNLDIHSLPHHVAASIISIIKNLEVK